MSNSSSSSSPSLIAPVMVVVVLAIFMATALMNVGQSRANAEPVPASSVASTDTTNPQG